MSKSRKPLTAKQQRFVQEYLIDLNATAAYKRAGYKAKGHAAEANAARMLRNAEVKAEIDKALADRDKRTEITVDLVVQETWETYQEARAAEKFSAAAVLLGSLGRHTGAFPNKHEVSGPNGGPLPVKVIGIEIVAPAPSKEDEQDGKQIPL